MTNRYICEKCGKTFDEYDTISYQEYPGSKWWTEEVSPCCGYYFDDVE